MKALQAQVETIKELLAKCGTLQVQATELIQESEALNGWQIELDTEVLLLGPTNHWGISSTSNWHQQLPTSHETSSGAAGRASVQL